MKNLPHPKPEPHRRKLPPQPDVPAGDYYQRQSFYFQHFFGTLLWPGLREAMKTRPKAAQAARATADLLDPHCFPAGDCEAFEHPAGGDEVLTHAFAGAGTEVTPGVYTRVSPTTGMIFAQAATGGGFQYLDVYAMLALDLTAWNSGRVYAAVEYDPELRLFGGGFGPESNPLDPNYYARIELVGYAEKGSESACQVQPMLHVPIVTGDEPEWTDLYEFWDVPVPWTFSWPIAEPFHVQAGDEFRLLVGLHLQTSNPLGQGCAFLSACGWAPEICVRIAPGE